MRKIEKIKNFRHYLLGQIEGLDTRQLNFTPPGFGNNIIWNIGHLTAAMLNLCYVKAGQPLPIADAHIIPFVSGTAPSISLENHEIDQIKRYFIESVERLESDLEKQIFNNYTPAAMIQKVYGVEVTNIDDALDYILFHEGYHASVILLLRKMIP